MRPLHGEAEPGTKLRRGRTGPSPRDDVGSLSRRVVLTTAFPSHRVSGGVAPSHSGFSSMGYCGGSGRKRRSDPAPLRFLLPLLSEPQFTSPYCHSHWASLLWG